MRARTVFERDGTVLDSLELKLPAYFFLESNPKPAGHLAIKAEPWGPLTIRVDLILRRKGRHDDLWMQEFDLNREAGPAGFEIENSSLFQGGGYFELFVREPAGAAVPAAHFAVAGRRKRGRSISVPGFLAESIANISRFQSVPVRVDGAVVRVPTADHAIHKHYLSLGAKDQSGKHVLFDFGEEPWSWNSPLIDLRMAVIMESAGQILGDKKMANVSAKTVRLLSRNGFDDRSGLGYFGQECGLNLRSMAPSPLPIYPYPKFKPFNEGLCPNMPEDALWAEAPQRMEQMMRSMFTGLITDPESMDYNRFCYYNFDARRNCPARMRDSGHCAFESIGARMILWWLKAYQWTGDTTFRDWADRMLSKWENVQHPTTGLTPNMFGGESSGPGREMLPVKWASAGGGALASQLIAEASTTLKESGKDRSLKKRLAAMALRQAHGILDYAYLPGQRYFREVTQLDGTAPRAAARYTFTSEAQKAKAVRSDPRLAGVSVYAGAGLYGRPGYWCYGAGTAIPVHLAKVAATFGDAQLSEKLQALVSDFEMERQRTTGAITPEGRWRFTATAYHVLFLLELDRAGLNRQSRDRAKEIAEDEINALGTMRYPEWWRMPERSEFLWALLQLARLNKGFSE